MATKITLHEDRVLWSSIGVEWFDCDESPPWRLRVRHFPAGFAFDRDTYRAGLLDVDVAPTAFARCRS